MLLDDGLAGGAGGVPPFDGLMLLLLLLSQQAFVESVSNAAVWEFDFWVIVGAFMYRRQNNSWLVRLHGALMCAAAGWVPAAFISTPVMFQKRLCARLKLFLLAGRLCCVQLLVPSLITNRGFD